MDTTGHISRDVPARPTSSTYAQTQKIPLAKKILYHLWDADQHLKSPQVRFSPMQQYQLCSYKVYPGESIGRKIGFRNPHLCNPWLVDEVY